MSDLTNLYDETISALSRNGHTLDNVERVNLYDTAIELGEFVQFAKGFDYDCGYGREYVPPFFVVMNDGSWYTRAEYDGSEWWEFHRIPAEPKMFGSIRAALVGADMDWCYQKAMERSYECDMEYLAALYEERMALYDELEAAVERPDESAGKWSWGRGRCATKSRCKRWGYSERPFTKGGGSWAKHQSRCWKDQRGKGANKRDTQYR